MKIIAFTILLFLPQFTSAQAIDSLDLGEVVITASKIPLLEKETTKPVTIIDANEIRRSAGKNLSELLNEQNGVVINGALSSPGKDKSVFLRGADTEYTLILIDGFPVSDPSGEGGAFDLRLLPLANVERIEIVKGSMSTLYGSDAIAGVINVITKNPGENAFNVNTQLSYGSFNTTDLLLGADGKSGVIDYSVNLSRKTTDGISEAESPEGEDYGRDGVTRNAVSAKVSISPVRQLKITPFLNYSDYDGDYDTEAFTDGENRYEATLLNTGMRLNYSTGDIDLRGAYSLTDTERTFTDDFGVFNPIAKLHNTDLFASYNKFESAKILLGLNYQSLNFELEDNEIDEDLNLLSPYATLYLKSGMGLNAELGVRLNNHSVYGTNWTYNIAPVYVLTEEIRLLISLSSGFKAPTLNELFGPFGANIDLKPQTSQTFDTGIEYNSNNSGLGASLHYFRRTVDDLIQYDFSSGYMNVNEQNDAGVEAKVSSTFQQSQIEIFYNYLEGAIKSEGIETENLIRRPNHSFGFNMLQNFTESLSAKLNGSFIGEREDIFFNPETGGMEEVELDQYFLINLHSQYEFPDIDLMIFLDVKNLTNADYTEVYGFNTPGIHFNTGIRYNF